MKRITMHLSGVKPQLVEFKNKNKDTGRYDFFNKKIIRNTIAQEFGTEGECISYMNDFIERNEELKNDIKVTKHYLSNC